MLPPVNTLINGDMGQDRKATPPGNGDNPLKGTRKSNETQGIPESRYEAARTTSLAQQQGKDPSPADLEQWYRQAYHQAHRLLGRHQLASEVAEESWTMFMVCLVVGAPIKCRMAYLLSIVRANAWKMKRGRSTKVVSLEDVEFEAEPEDRMAAREGEAGATPDWSYDSWRRALSAVLPRALTALTPRQRRPWCASRLARTGVEVAAWAGLSPRDCRHAMSEIAKKIRGFLPKAPPLVGRG